jgi:ketosteroid isomerase-like protein
VDPRQVVNLYYAAWQQRAGDMSGVPLADDFTFTGPVASFTDAAGYAAMARQAGTAVRNFRVRHQFADGDLVCSVVDWEMDPLPGVLTAAEILQVRDGTIVRGELIYDAEELRRAMSGDTASIRARSD